MQLPDDEITDLWKIFHANNLKYIIVGGFAINFNGYQRYTGDLDILIEDSSENRKILRRCILEKGLGDFKEIETMTFIPGWSEFKLDSGFSLEIMTDIKGIPQKDFLKVYEASNVIEIKGIKIRFLNIDQLIHSKKECGRPKDLLDVEELIKIKNLKK